MAQTVLGEVRDQSLHMVYGLGLMVAFVLPMHPLIALVLTMVVAVERELEQHNWAGVGKLDLCFWFVACSLSLIGFHQFGYI